MKLDTLASPIPVLVREFWAGFQFVFKRSFFSFWEEEEEDTAFWMISDLAPTGVTKVKFSKALSLSESWINMVHVNAEAEALKEKGNEFVAQKNWPAAAKKYKKGKQTVDI